MMHRDDHGRTVARRPRGGEHGRVAPGKLRGDGGFSLSELLVTMTLLSVVLSIAVTSFIVLHRAIDETDQRFDDLGVARVVMDATTKSLRAAVAVGQCDHPFGLARPDAVLVTSNVDVAAGNPARRVHFERTADDALIQTFLSGDVDGDGDIDGDGDCDDADWFGGSVTSQRMLVPAGGVAEFTITYFDHTGTVLTNGDADLSATDKAEVLRVEIDIAVRQEPRGDVAAAHLRNRVWLPNRYYDNGGQG